MSYYSLNQIRSVGNIANFSQKNLERKSLSYKRTVFLSHSHQDNDIVGSVIEFLLTIGVYVYVDWLDPTMPQITSAETASKIKERINQCERFVVLLTENSKESKWVPWELGFADAKKENDKIGIFPVKRSPYTNDSEFSGLEYMQLYRRIELGTIVATGKAAPCVFAPHATQGPTLDQWLR